MTNVQELGLSYRNACEYPENWTVRASREISYDVVVSHGILNIENPVLAMAGTVSAASRGSRRLVIIDSNVDKLFGTKIRQYFQHHDVEVKYHVIEACEVVKNWDSVSSVVSAMAAADIDRRSEPIIGIGGGVLLDIVGFAASIYRRSTPYIRIPTTLIGLIDAGIGIKTGVNFDQGKNKIGTYAAPVVSYIDRSFLGTLERRHVANGLAEILKMALIRSSKLTDLLATHGRAMLDDSFSGTDPSLASAMDAVISMSIQLMLEELQPNLWETNLERCVDFGHTFSPTIEMEALPEILHGEAVNIDMIISSVISFNRHLMDHHDLSKILTVMRSLELPTWNSILENPKLLSLALADTQRHRGGQQRIPLPVGVGNHVFVNDVTEKEIATAIALLKTLSQAESDSFMSLLNPEYMGDRS